MRGTVAVWTFTVVLLATAATIASAVERLQLPAGPIVASVKSHVQNQVQNVGHAFHKQVSRVVS